jgi:hypothetical protein
MNKQKEILKYLSTVESAKLDEIYKAMPFEYYCNGLKHTGNILSRMVKDGSIIRIKKGVFRKAKIEEHLKVLNAKYDKENENPNQMDLF